MLKIILFMGLWLIQPSKIFLLECGRRELPCEDGKKCIKNKEWCDRQFHCADGSDEYHCSGDSCRNNSLYFLCSNRRCVPLAAACNGFDNCGDGSDEYLCSEDTSNFLRSSSMQKRGAENLPVQVKKAVTRAAEYLLSKRNPDYGWGSFTPRAIVALTFAEAVFTIPEQEKVLMKKSLEVRLLLELKRNKGRLNLIDLALYINALYALCQNPRNFNGVDLVESLRLETERQADLNLPLALMTLCIADVRNINTTKLISMYDDVRNYRKGFKALTVLAMTACRYFATLSDRLEMYRRMNSFSKALYKPVKYDIHSGALLSQAVISRGRSVQHNLEANQLADGSFGDLLATYYVIPVLLNSSLLNLKCSGRISDGATLGVSLSNSVAKHIAYSLWITEDADANSTMFITLQGNKTLFDAMTVAKSRNKMFRFMYDTRPEGMRVYSVAGLPNDAETGIVWKLYRGAGNGSWGTTSTLKEETLGIDKIFPVDGSHFIFWRRRDFP